ncbi:MAG TPA: AAA family ATPase [Candidatus Paceibacterota bacterium]|nr:AAA family ATPase [Candidatus Paceibacterota bacterium]
MSTKKVRRVNFFGGPCSSKSTTAAYTFSYLKSSGYQVEYVTEYIKFWTYIPRIPKSFDSLYCLAKQVHKEDTILRGETDLIVSDSPLMLQYFYAVHHNAPVQIPMLEISKEMEDTYPSLNIFLKRKDRDYSSIGRYETLEQAKQVDEELMEVLKRVGVKYKTFSYHDKEKIIRYIFDKIIRKVKKSNE